MDRAIPGHITGLYLYTVINLLILVHISFVRGEITVVDTVKNITIATYDDMPALFGSTLPVNGFSGVLVYVQPHNACTPVKKPPEDIHINTNWIALIAREGCDFAEKILNVQLAGYRLGIVHNRKNDDGLVPMSAGEHGRYVSIPSVFVGYQTGMDMADNFDYRKRNILLNVDNDIPLPNYKQYLWPFAIVVGTCFCLMVLFMIAKWCRDRRRRNRSRLSTKHLKKIPIKKFKKGDYYDVCAICLDDYEEGDKLRILPCSHAYHRKCIDPWLTKNRKTCPICKRRVIPGDEHESESETDEEAGSQPSERTPLLTSSQTSSRSSTFDRSGLPESVRAEVRRPTEEDSDSINSLQGAVGGVEIQNEENRTSADDSSFYIPDEELSNTDTNALQETTSLPHESSSLVTDSDSVSLLDSKTTKASNSLPSLISLVSPVRDIDSTTKKKGKAKNSKKSSKTSKSKGKSKSASTSKPDGASTSERAMEEVDLESSSSSQELLASEISTPIRTSSNKGSGQSTPRGANSSPTGSGGSNPAFVNEEDEVSFSRDSKKSKQNQVI